MSTSSAFVSAATHAPLVDGPQARQLEAIDLALQRLAKTGSTRTTLLLVNLARFGSCSVTELAARCGWPASTTWAAIRQLSVGRARRTAPGGPLKICPPPIPNVLHLQKTGCGSTRMVSLSPLGAALVTALLGTMPND
jgi:hypothetical protein